MKAFQHTAGDIFGSFLRLCQHLQLVPLLVVPPGGPPRVDHLDVVERLTSSMNGNQEFTAPRAVVLGRVLVVLTCRNFNDLFVKEDPLEGLNRGNRLNVDLWGSLLLEADPWVALPRRSVIAETIQIHTAS
jgi:hypothetical protein